MCPTTTSEALGSTWKKRGNLKKRERQGRRGVRGARYKIGGHVHRANNKGPGNSAKCEVLSARVGRKRKEGKAAHAPRCEQAHLEERVAAQVDGELCARVEHALVVGRATG